MSKPQRTACSRTQQPERSNLTCGISLTHVLSRVYCLGSEPNPVFGYEVTGEGQSIRRNRILNSKARQIWTVTHSPADTQA